MGKVPFAIIIVFFSYVSLLRGELVLTESVYQSDRPVVELKNKQGVAILVILRDFDSDENAVTIQKDEYGPRSSFSMDLLSTQSQRLVKDWHTARAIRNSMMISAKRVTLGGGRERYKIEVRNFSSHALTDVNVQYQVHIQRESVNQYGTSRGGGNEAGSIRIGNMAAGEDKEVETDIFVLNRSKSKSSKYVTTTYTNGSSTTSKVGSKTVTARDNLKGLVAHVVWNGHRLKTYATNPSLLDSKATRTSPNTPLLVR